MRALSLWLSAVVQLLCLYGCHSDISGQTDSMLRVALHTPQQCSASSLRCVIGLPLAANRAGLIGRLTLLGYRAGLWQRGQLVCGDAALPWSQISALL